MTTGAGLSSCKGERACVPACHSQGMASRARGGSGGMRGRGRGGKEANGRGGGGGGGGCDEQMRVVDVADKEMDSLQVRYYQTSE